MNRDEAKAMLPIITAFAEGKRVENRTHDGKWSEITLPNFNGPASEYRIAPDPPAVGSLEWVKTLPPDTKVRMQDYLPEDSITANDAIACRHPGPWFIVGTAEWANALPEGTKVRHKAWRGSDGWFARKGSEWFNHKGRPVIMDGSLWELYREPSIRPWKPEEVPVGKMVRRKGSDEELMITGRHGEEAHICGLGWRKLSDLATHFVLTDGSPCGVEEER